MHFLLPHPLRDKYSPGKVKPEYAHLLMPFSKSMQTSGSFGDVVTEVFKGTGYEVWQHHFFIRQGVRLLAVCEAPVLTINYMLKGNPTADIPGIGHVVLPCNFAQMFYVPKMECPILFDAGEYVCMYIVFKPAYIKRLLPAFPHLLELYNASLKKSSQLMLQGAVKVAARAKGILAKLMNRNEDYTDADFFMQARVLDLLMIYVTGERGKRSKNKNGADAPLENMEDIKSFIEKNMDKPLCTKALAKKYGKCESEFYRAFRQRFKQSPHNFIQKIRMERGMKLIRSTEHSLGYIALLVGFCSLAHSSNAFRNVYGRPPSAYRTNR